MIQQHKKPSKQQQEHMNTKLAMSDLAEENVLLKRQVKTQQELVEQIAEETSAKNPEQILQNINMQKSIVKAALEAFSIENEDSKKLLDALAAHKKASETRKQNQKK